MNRLGSGKARGIAHDAPGFGFTDRPDGDDDDYDDVVSGGLHPYGTDNNVGIGLALLKESLVEEVVSDDDDSTGSGKNAADIDGVEKAKDEAKSIAIFGHSMGSKAALLMALQCHTQKHLQLRPKLVVLVAPALEGLSLPSNGDGKSKKRLSKRRSSNESKGWITKVTRTVWVTWRRVFLDYPFQYGLRRLVRYVSCYTCILDLSVTCFVTEHSYRHNNFPLH